VMSPRAPSDGVVPAPRFRGGRVAGAQRRSAQATGLRSSGKWTAFYDRGFLAAPACRSREDSCIALIVMSATRAPVANVMCAGWTLLAGSRIDVAWISKGQMLSPTSSSSSIRSRVPVAMTGVRRLTRPRSSPGRT